jgi:hypothetical protein
MIEEVKHEINNNKHAKRGNSLCVFIGWSRSSFLVNISKLSPVTILDKYHTVNKDRFVVN